MALQVKNLKRLSAAQKDAVAQRVAQRLWIGRDFFFIVSAKTLTRVYSESQIQAADFPPAKLAPFGSRSAIDSGFRGTCALCADIALQVGKVTTNFRQRCKNYDIWLTGPNPRLYCAPFQVKGAFSRSCRN